MDKLKRRIYFNKNLFLFLIVLVLVGVGAGALFSLILSDGDKKLVTDYLNDFITNISKSNFNWAKASSEFLFN